MLGKAYFFFLKKNNDFLGAWKPVGRGRWLWGEG